MEHGTPRSESKPPTFLKNSAETSQKMFPRNTISLVPPIRPDLVPKFTKFISVSISMKIGIMNN